MLARLVMSCANWRAELIIIVCVIDNDYAVQKKMNCIEDNQKLEFVKAVRTTLYLRYKVDLGEISQRNGFFWIKRLSNTSHTVS